MEISVRKSSSTRRPGPMCHDAQSVFKHVSLSCPRPAVFNKVRQVSSRCALKSQNLRGRGKDLHNTLDTKFQSSPQKSTSPSAMSQPTTGSRESTTDSPQIQYYYCIPSLPSCSCRHSLVSTATNPATTVPTAAAQWSIPMRNPGEAFCHQSGLPLVQRQTTPASSDPELVVCSPCLVQRLCHPWA
jgi:hypothetical protein